MAVRKDNKGILFTLPALGLLGFSILLPFLAAALMTLTNQRMLTPNPTEFVGLENYSRLLSVTVREVPREIDQQGEPVVDADGNVVYQRLQPILRSDPELRAYQTLTEFDVGPRRYAILAKDLVFWRALGNTFFFVLLVVPIQIGTALGLALLVNQDFRGRTAFRTFFFAPVVTSMVVASIVWSFLYNENTGLINQLLGAIAGSGVVAINWLGSEALALPSIAIMSAWQGAGFQMLIILAGLQSVDQQLYEAARLDGASRWQQFRHVTLPGLRNTLIFVVIATTIAAFGLFIQVDVMTQGGPNDATATLIYHAIRSGFREQDVAYGASVAVIYFLLVLAVALAQRRLTRSADER
ncbi:MAG: sugar ABC transporter permease [Pseudomonadota bacterium]